MSNSNEVRHKTRQCIADHLAMIEEEAVVEWVGAENFEVANDELSRIIRRLRPSPSRTS